MYELIPDELKKIPHWICWKAIPDPSGQSHSGIKKEPINPKNGWRASSTNPNTWTDFVTAVSASVDFAGIGFVFKDSGYFGIDIDDRPEELQSFLQGDHDNMIGEIVDTLKSYTELSQSGNGIHIICKGQLPGADFNNHECHVEMYQNARFFIMTGNACAEYADISDCTESVKPFHERYRTKRAEKHSAPPKQLPLQPSSMSAQEVIDKIKASANAQKFAALYAGDLSGYVHDNGGADHSAADLALCNILAFWCGGNASLIDEIFRTSGLMRDKWDRPTAGSTYGKMTIQKALDDCSTYYSGRRTASGGSGYHVNIQNTAGVSGKRYTLDDTGNAQRFCDAYRSIILYHFTDKTWMFWQDGKWHIDAVCYHRVLADAIVEQMARDESLYDDIDAFRKHLKKSRSFTAKTNMCREAEHLLPATAGMFDRDKTVINCKNGVLSLKDGQIIPHEPAQMLTRQATVPYDENAPEPTVWLHFLHDIFGGDKDMICYIQKCIGYSLTGSTSEQCAFFLYGTGRNGKSTLLEVLRFIMGDYATNIQPQTIMVNPKSGNAPSSDIARLKGARLVTTVEPDEGMRLAEGLLKQLTGGDIVTARKMYGNEFEFKPEFKLWMATNYKIIIRGTDVGIWRRIHLIPFEVQIPEHKVDKSLKRKLFQECAGIFKWAVDGCRLWQKEGLTKPKAVVNATGEYKREMDTIGCFLSECCTDGEGQVAAGKLFAAYLDWAHKNNEHTFTQTKFGQAIGKRYERIHTKHGWVYRGIRLDDDYSITVG